MPVLTSSIINNAEIKDKIYYIWDDMVKGFALKVIPNGQKKYVIKYRTSMGGRNAVQRWYIFGDIQSLSCKEAREEAAKLFLMIHDGKDPQEEKASLSDAIRHINHIVDLIGIDHVGIGSDFDGDGELIGCSATNELINITVRLLEEGYTEEDIRKIWGGNLLRVMTAIQDFPNK